MEFDKLLLADVGHDSDDTSTTVPWLDFADGTLRRLRRSVPGGLRLVHRPRHAAVARFCLDGANSQGAGASAFIA